MKQNNNKNLKKASHQNVVYSKNSELHFIFLVTNTPMAITVIENNAFLNRKI